MIPGAISWVFFCLVAELKPSFFVMENVKGLGYPDARPILDEALSLVAEQFEIVGPLILDAADFGAATRRRRLFVIGLDRQRCARLTAATIKGAMTEPATVRAAIGDLASAKEVGDQDGFDAWKICRPGRPSRYAALLRTSDLIFTGHRTTRHTKEVIRRFRSLKPGETDEVGRHPRLAWDGQCPTLRAGTGNDRGSYQSVRPIHPTEARVITVREAARLQGFPDAFKFHPTVWHSFRMIGNSVSPIIAYAIFSLLKARIELPARVLEAAE